MRTPNCAWIARMNSKTLGMVRRTYGPNCELSFNECWWDKSLELRAHGIGKWSDVWVLVDVDGKCCPATIIKAHHAMRAKLNGKTTVESDT